MLESTIAEIRAGLRNSQSYADNARAVADNILSSERDLCLRTSDIIAQSRQRMQAISNSIFRIVPVDLLHG